VPKDLRPKVNDVQSCLMNRSINKK